MRVATSARSWRTGTTASCVALAVCAALPAIPASASELTGDFTAAFDEEFAPETDPVGPVDSKSALPTCPLLAQAAILLQL